MNKTKKNFLSASSILTIVAAAFAMLLGLGAMVCSSFISEDFLLDIYEADPSSEIVKELDGGYIIYTTDDDGEVTTIDDETLVIIVDVMKVGCVVLGLVSIGFAVAKLVLAILILKANKKDEYRKGISIALLVLSVLTNAWLEAAFIIVAMCLKSETKKTDEAVEDNKQEDVVLKDINE